VTSAARRRSRRATGAWRGDRSILVARRAGSWLVWWILLMSFWVVLDNSIDTDELLAGAGAAALGAFLAEVACHQAATRFRMRIEWVVPALSLPSQVASDMVIVFAALWRCLTRGEQPSSGFRQVPVRYGSDTADGETRRVLLVGGNSVAPNSFALGLDAEREVMVIHQLVVNQGEPVPGAEAEE
jgi:multisubunit Na+/H+ antiporter MnhE subunit